MKLVFATHNINKAAEIQKIMPDSIQVLTLTDIGCHEEIPETASTLEGNALLKAQHVWNHYGLSCFADDTGLEIHALNGEPGVFSARYAGEAKDAGANMDLVLKKLDGITDRSARFRTVIALILDGQEHLFEGIVDGGITDQKTGAHGFGYDPIFRPAGSERTFAQMEMTEKNAVSHRGRAVQQLVAFLSEKRS